ncbi:MAG TPA: hypothetical protein PKN13_01485 [Accumulibacter sp.]|nr:hypothetical protein [Accumulibacter sp.]HMW16481.1 hypothetical protein [Accumulibacter sp.]HMX22207.1 hypothetical protein [Accumulibacter sp.]HNC16850.1 hypothetical protein [Accumulibacter sp.]HND79284.1 hypothetical protein [Accumulibacter sp.]
MRLQEIPIVAENIGAECGARTLARRMDTVFSCSFREMKLDFKSLAKGPSTAAGCKEERFPASRS